jgi:hypothetical protein
MLRLEVLDHLGADHEIEGLAEVQGLAHVVLDVSGRRRGSDRLGRSRRRP